MSNGKGINWTVIGLASLMFVIGICIPSPFSPSCPDIRISAMDSTVVAVPGVPDTVVSVGQSYQGRVSDTIYVATLPDIPVYVEVEVDTVLAGGTKVYIRGTTYLHKVKNEEGEDNLLVVPTIEWNIQERPCRNIIRIDTTKTYYPATIEYEASWYNKPEIIVPTTISLTAILFLIILL